MTKKPIRRSFPPVEDTLPPKRVPRTAAEVLKSPESSKHPPKIKK